MQAVSLQTYDHAMNLTTDDFQRDPGVIKSETEFGAIMENIDGELAKEQVPIHARPIRAVSFMSKRLDIALPLTASDATLIPGCFSPEQISLRINQWMRVRYGERLKMDWTVGRSAVLLHGALFTIRCPVIFGSCRFECNPSNFGKKRPPAARNEPAQSDILDHVEDFTPALAASLSPTDAIRLLAVFQTAMDAYLSLDDIRKTNYFKEMWCDLNTAVMHLTATGSHYGMSKWSSAQAVEKLFKSFILAGGDTPTRTHDLQKLAKHAARLGLPLPPSHYLEECQCSPGARYGEESSTMEAALRSHLISLELCKSISPQIAKLLGITPREYTEPSVDGMPLSEYLRVHGIPKWARE